ncbi:hypothetical protein IEQ34_020603 [Dendrobium chrysotoxum]|uniref:Uncharacterized protein n=1 Tax=Dendrobium chrysotoxum TaxID=161865 RepID=A0AAV7G0L7_DENCH|nr:hypothetical protein IEQ34_020603 [Dendrobium chrysotoxum]
MTIDGSQFTIVKSIEFSNIKPTLEFVVGFGTHAARIAPDSSIFTRVDLPKFSHPNKKLKFVDMAALYTHHQYIAGFIMTGAFAHGAIFFIRDYNRNRMRIIWASLFLGFHTLGLYVHNDVMLAFGTPEKKS